MSNLPDPTREGKENELLKRALMIAAKDAVRLCRVAEEKESEAADELASVWIAEAGRGE